MRSSLSQVKTQHSARPKDFHSTAKPTSEISGKSKIPKPRSFIPVQRRFLTAEQSGQASARLQEGRPCRENRPQRGCQSFSCNNQPRSFSIHGGLQGRWQEGRKEHGFPGEEPPSPLARSKLLWALPTLRTLRRGRGDSCDTLSAVA